MLEQIILAIVQGVTEWLPISSSAAIYFVQTQIFGYTGTLDELLRDTLFLHLCTFLAALVYFRADVIELVKTLLSRDSVEEDKQKVFDFLFWSTVLTAAFAFFVYVLITDIEYGTTNPNIGIWLNVIIAVLLFVTAWTQLSVREKKSSKSELEIQKKDTVLLGFAQALSVVPGLSRSGTTVAVLLMRGFKKDLALRLSFLMSLPVVLGGNIILNYKEFANFGLTQFVTVTVTFLVGIITIHVLLKLARRINFGYFVLFFAVLTFIAAFI